MYTPVLTLYWRAIRRAQRRREGDPRLLFEAVRTANRLAILATGPVGGKW
jgi:hypothetical protein